MQKGSAQERARRKAEEVVGTQMLELVEQQTGDQDTTHPRQERGQNHIEQSAGQHGAFLSVLGCEFSKAVKLLALIFK